jgi:ABC-type spermidine/putrescine transport system permease subunit II
LVALSPGKLAALFWYRRNADSGRGYVTLFVVAAFLVPEIVLKMGSLLFLGGGGVEDAVWYVRNGF